MVPFAAIAKGNIFKMCKVNEDNKIKPGSE